MFTNEIVDAEMQRDGVFMRFKVFAISESLALKTLQFLPNGQERPLDVRRGKAF